MNFDSANDRLPIQNYDEEINRPISQDQVQVEFLNVKNQQSLNSKPYQEHHSVPCSERESEHSYEQEVQSEQLVDVLESFEEDLPKVLEESVHIEKQDRKPAEEVKEGPGGSNEIYTEDGSIGDPRNAVAGDFYT